MITPEQKLFIAKTLNLEDGLSTEELAVHARFAVQKLGWCILEEWNTVVDSMTVFAYNPVGDKESGLTCGRHCYPKNEALTWCDATLQAIYEACQYISKDITAVVIDATTGTVMSSGNIYYIEAKEADIREAEMNDAFAHELTTRGLQSLYLSPSLLRALKHGDPIGIATAMGWDVSAIPGQPVTILTNLTA